MTTKKNDLEKQMVIVAKCYKAQLKAETALDLATKTLDDSKQITMFAVFELFMVCNNDLDREKATIFVKETFEKSKSQANKLIRLAKRVVIEAKKNGTSVQLASQDLCGITKEQEKDGQIVTQGRLHETLFPKPELTPQDRKILNEVKVLMMPILNGLTKEQVSTALDRIESHWRTLKAQQIARKNQKLKKVA